MDILDLSSICGNSSVWDYELTVNSTSPDLTVCFQDTLLAWVPCGLLWVATPFYLLYLARKAQTHSWKSWSTLNVLKVVFAVLLILLYAAIAIYAAVDTGLRDDLAKLITAGITCISTILITVLMRYGFVKGEHTSGVAFGYWILQVIAGIVPARSYVSGVKQDEDIFWKITFYISYGLTCVEFILQLFSDKRASRHYWAVSGDEGEDEVFVRGERRRLLSENNEAQTTTPRAEKLPPSPELTASFLSNSTYAWVTGLLWKGYKKPLQARDLWDLMPRDRTKPLIDLFYKAWLKSSKILSPPSRTSYRDFAQSPRTGSAKVGKSSYSTFSDVKYTSLENAYDDLAADRADLTESSHTWKTNASIAKALIRAFGGYYMLVGVFEVLNITISFIRPTLLDYLIGFVETGDPFVWHGYVLGLSLFWLNILRALTTQKFYYGKFVTGVQIRGSLTAAVYRKALRLSNSARNKYSVGQIVNLMSVDAQRVADVTFFIHDLWSAPVSITVAITLLYSYLGPASLAGLGILLLLIACNLCIAGLVKKIQFKILGHKDQRLKLTNEILNGMKVLKLYAWESAFEDRLNATRDKEVALLRIVGYLTSGTAITFTCTPVLYAVVAFSVFALTSGATALTPQVAFVSLTLVNALVRPLAYLPQGVAGLVQAAVSLKRLQNFLNDDELDESAVDRKDTAGDVAIDIQNGAFAWDNEKTTLQKINLRVGKGQLVAVVGQVGSGKSSLISAMLGELNKVTGHVKVSGSTAYVPQEAWIRNESLQNNVLFGRESRKRKYDTILDACALTEDLKILPAGDQTEIGEKGINLSGGQKQRVSIARAVYQDADVYLLDDPLSAVDSHVAKHIFEQVIGEKGLLRNKTRVLVTHGITFLPRADVIVVVKNGQISELGSYQELLQHEGAFAEFIMTYLNEKEDEEDVDPEEKSVRDQLKRQISAWSVDIPSDGSGSEKSGPRKRRVRRQSTVSSAKTKLSRQISKVAKPEVDRSKLTEKETSASGGVKLSTFWSYAKACGYACVVTMLLSNLLFLAADVGSNIWLSEWSEDASREVPASVEFRLGIYGALGAVLAISVLFQTFSLAVGCTRASKILHTDLLYSIMRAPMAFFDTTPVGRILNRFSQDLNVIDASMRLTIFLFVRGLMGLVATIVAISYTTPIFLAFVVPLFIVYYFVQRFYVITSNQLRRIMSVKTSPIYSHFGESVAGASSIRAYRQRERFTGISDALVDDMQVARYTSILTNRWLGVGMEIIGSSVVLFSALYAVIARDTLTGGLVGLSISYALQVTDRLSVLVQNLSDLETNVVAVERINDYSEVPSEARWEIPDHRPPREWPAEGQVTFQSLSTRYRPGLDLVLKDIKLQINPQEKLGVVGRTGAGKSSMMLGLFRLVEPATGRILIDGLDTGSIGLHDLRSKITIIPQDPVLFSGTLRSNLDPFESHADQELWTALEQAYLKPYIDTLPGGLEYPCSEGGQNLSVGQRQLVCLARALLRKSKILVLDEATAAVDMETDELIQQTIRTAFKESTVLTIAHRLNTVLDYDRIMVLDAGRVSELGKPADLLKDTKGAFYSMAKEANLI